MHSQKKRLALCHTLTQLAALPRLKTYLDSSVIFLQTSKECRVLLTSTSTWCRSGYSFMCSTVTMMRLAVSEFVFVNLHFHLMDWLKGTLKGGWLSDLHSLLKTDSMFKRSGQQLFRRSVLISPCSLKARLRNSSTTLVLTVWSVVSVKVLTHFWS